jgi:transcription-repair coupling factor (superfamily II helicase)
MLPDIRWEAGATTALGKLPLAAHAEVLLALVATQKRPIMYVGATESECAQVRALCESLGCNVPLHELPAWDALPYDRVSPSAHVSAARLKTLSQLQNTPHSPCIVFTTMQAVRMRYMPPEALSGSAFPIAVNTELNRDALLHFLQRYGYERREKAVEPGEYAVRGSIIDIFPSGDELAIRVDMFGDEVESLRYFDPLTQRSESECQQLTLHAAREITLDKETIARFRTQYREAFGAVTKNDPLYDAISEGIPYAGMEHWLPLFFDRLVTVNSYAKHAYWVIDQRAEQIGEDRYEAVEDYYQARHIQHQSKARDASVYHPVEPNSLYLDSASYDAMRTRMAVLHISGFDVASGFTLPAIEPAPILTKNRDTSAAIAQLSDIHANGMQRVILASNSPGSAERIQNMLNEHGIVIEQQPSLAKALGAKKTLIQQVILPIDHGYRSHHFLLLSEADLLGEKVIRTQRKKRKSGAFFQEMASLSEGELVVHREHGIGRFEAIVTVEVHGSKHDCLKLIYDGEDKLFLPVENIELISRYGDGDGGASGTVPLDKLGGVSWQKRKAALKKKLRMAASALMKIAAKRATILAPELVADNGLYDEFCARFPYTETEDQLQAIADIKADLASGRAADRLICGDVGFGKTEVALRAAFIAVASKQQVAVVVPTTLLARQHYQTFMDRFKGMPVRIGQLSRMVSAKEASRTREAIADGTCDIVIGTHALLSENIRFQQLGLLIIDEEQHFGVKQKEKLKALKGNIHVITLSATPIPRTLQMSLSGVRELSLITTPPVDRLAIRTSVMPFDPVVIREALLRERHRGGKSFYVTPRIKYMVELKARLEELVPELRIGVAHGDMPARALDDAMNAMMDGAYDVLLSTAIIESGIDLPSANTIIIDRPHMFGLSQLYQLRGRVGRGKLRAYAYLTLPLHTPLTSQATKRLEVMQQLDHLGAGFSIASHDMDIRGYGNLLGEEQSGHIKEVGVELYQAMLEEAIADMKERRSGESASHDWSPQINLGISVLIPEHYIEDASLRISMYRRIGQLESEDAIEDMQVELHDRFGAVPDETKHLLDVMRLKLLCKQAGIARLDMGDKAIIVSFKGNMFQAADALFAHIAQAPSYYKIRADQSLLVREAVTDAAKRLPVAMRVVRGLANLLPCPENEKAA